MSKKEFVEAYAKATEEILSENQKNIIQYII